MLIQSLFCLCAFLLGGASDQDLQRRVLLEASLERLACGTTRPTDEDDVVWLAHLLSSPQAALDVHDRLAQDKRLSPKLEAALWPLVVDELVRRGRFAEATRSWRPPITTANELVPGLLDCLYPGARVYCCNGRVTQLRDIIRQLPRLEGFYLACVREKHWNTVAVLERELTAGLPDPRVNALFVRANVRAGNCDRARAQLADIERELVGRLAPGVVPPWLADVRATAASCR